MSSSSMQAPRIQAPRASDAPAPASRVIRAGLIGCGEVARRYAAALAVEQPGRLLLACVTDAASAEGQRFAESSGFRFIRSIDSLLAEKVDLICICTPNATHAEIAGRCLEAGKHVLLEHPMATSLPDAEHLRETARRVGLQLFVVRQRRFLASVQMVRRMLEMGLLGEIRSVHAGVCWNRRAAYFTEKPWRADRDNGGVVLNQASHFLDILLFLFGEPRSVEMQRGNIRHAIGVEDSARGTIHFPAVSANFSCTTAAPEGWNRAFLKIVGDRHCIELGGQGWERFTTQLPEEISGLESSLEAPVSGEHAGYFERVARSLSGEAVGVVDAEEGIRAVRLIDSLYANAPWANTELAAYFDGIFQEKQA